jgi:hypothetical protein
MANASETFTERWGLDEKVPAVMNDADLRRVLDISVSAFYQMKKDGKFDGLMCKPQITKNTRYSGALVSRWIAGR